jgi:hypothetical protein
VGEDVRYPLGRWYRIHGARFLLFEGGAVAAHGHQGHITALPVRP